MAPARRDGNFVARIEIDLRSDEQSVTEEKEEAVAEVALAEQRRRAVKRTSVVVYRSVARPGTSGRRGSIWKAPRVWTASMRAGLMALFKTSSFACPPVARLASG
jgi:hypothetical protein